MEHPSAEILIGLSNSYNEHVSKFGEAENNWYWSTNEDGVAAYPFGFDGELFRGQTKDYAFCYGANVPSFARGLKVASNADVRLSIIAERSIKQKWFMSEFQKHPCSKYKGLISINEKALMQHYGIPTECFDFTHSFDVAAFFATCEYNMESNSWVAADNGVGIIYKIKMPLPDKAWHVKTITISVFPRPFQQKAWIFHNANGPEHSLDSCQYIEHMTFRHKKSVGNHFLEKFDNGEKLFPNDPLALVADKINNSKQMAEYRLDEFAKESEIDEVTKGRLKDNLEKKGFTFVCEENSVFTEDMIANCEDNYLSNFSKIKLKVRCLA